MTNTEQSTSITIKIQDTPNGRLLKRALDLLKQEDGPRTMGEALDIARNQADFAARLLDSGPGR
jgi:hypothetical protein